MRSRLYAALLLGLLVFSGCGLPNRNIADRLNTNDVVGVWTATSETLRLAQQKHGLPADVPLTITLRPDGTTDFRVIDCAGKLVEEKGTWTLEHNVNWGNVPVQNLLRIKAPQTEIQYGFARESGALRIWEFLGDPDAWELIEFTRTAAFVPLGAEKKP